MKKKQIQLPTGCLSYSQVTLWMSSPARYKEIFFKQNDGARFFNEGMAFGKIVADSLEYDKPTGNDLIDTMIELLPKYDIRDKEIEAILETKDGDIKIISHPDMLDSKTKALREIKTGKGKWTQKKADSWFQIKFYAMLIYIKYGVIPPTAHLDWIETFKDVDDIIKPTGKLTTFEVKITMMDILQTMAITTKVAKEIEREWVVFVPEPEIPF